MYFQVAASSSPAVWSDPPNTISTQTEWSDGQDEAPRDDHQYSFSLEDTFNTFGLDDSVKILKEKIEKLEEKLNSASENIRDLQEQLQEYESKRFSLDKIKDDNDAMSFYTGFQNYGVFNSVFEYLEGKASRLQYWRG